MLTSREEKVKMFKEQLLEGMEVDRMEGNKVYVKGGAIDFDALGDCYVATTKSALNEVLLKTMTRDNFTAAELSEIVLEILMSIK